MHTMHELTLDGKCPEDGEPDHYLVTVETAGVIPVETILKQAREIAAHGDFQEILTERLARAISARVTTIGYHSGVKTTCTAGLL